MKEIFLSIILFSIFSVSMVLIIIMCLLDWMGKDDASFAIDRFLEIYFPWMISFCMGVGVYLFLGGIL